MLDPKLLAPETVRPLRVADFERLIAAGAFVDERVELLRGQLIEMSPQGPKHIRVTARIHAALLAQLRGGRLEVLSHSSVQLDDDSMPEPDVAVVPRLDWEARPRDALLMVEVADSSLAKDRGIKLPLYAAAGVPEYWIVDVAAGQVEVFTRPSGTGYRMHRVVERTGVLKPIRLRGIEIPVADIVPPPKKRARRGH